MGNEPMKKQCNTAEVQVQQTLIAKTSVVAKGFNFLL